MFDPQPSLESSQSPIPRLKLRACAASPSHTSTMCYLFFTQHVPACTNVLLAYHAHGQHVSVCAWKVLGTSPATTVKPRMPSDPRIKHHAQFSCKMEQACMFACQHSHCTGSHEYNYTIHAKLAEVLACSACMPSVIREMPAPYTGSGKHLMVKLLPHKLSCGASLCRAQLVQDAHRTLAGHVSCMGHVHTISAL